MSRRPTVNSLFYLKISEEIKAVTIDILVAIKIVRKESTICTFRIPHHQWGRCNFLLCNLQYIVESKQFFGSFYDNITKVVYYTMAAIDVTTQSVALPHKLELGFW